MQVRGVLFLGMSLLGETFISPSSSCWSHCQVFFEMCLFAGIRQSRGVLVIYDDRLGAYNR